jgi:hypothetical protein
MSPGWMRANIPDEWKESYLSRLQVAQDWARERSGDVRAVVWRDLPSPNPKP